MKRRNNSMIRYDIIYKNESFICKCNIYVHVADVVDVIIVTKEVEWFDQCKMYCVEHACECCIYY